MRRCRPSRLNSIPAVVCARQADSDWGWASLRATRRRVRLGRRRRVAGPSVVATNSRSSAWLVMNGAEAGADHAGLLDAGVIQDRQNIVGHHAG